MQMLRKYLATATIGLAAVAPALWPADASAQKTAEESLASLKVADGLEITLWAAEPMLVNPTNIDIDARGRVWVLEAANYRASMRPWKTVRPEGDRIVILEDTNNDGKADSAKTFYQSPNLQAPLGIAVLGNKVYVAQSPNLLIFEIDESGDKPKGEPQVLLTGFGGTDHDHGLHAGIVGPDGKFYFNAGNDGSSQLVKSGSGTFGAVKAGDAIIDQTGSEVGRGGKVYRGKPKDKGVLGYTDGMAFRMDLDGKNFETLGYNFRNNYELTVDSFGTVWQSDNDDDGNQSVRINYVMEGGNFGFKGPKGTDWKRDSTLFPDQTKQEAHWHQRFPGIVPNLLNTGGGSPTGITIYEGTLLPEKFRGALLHCDAGPNVVRAYVTSPSSTAPKGLMKNGETFEGATDAGAGFKAVPFDLIKGDQDKWFRPADVCIAPDGSVYVADWYDPGVGGHNTGDAKIKDAAGKETLDPKQMRGRIYRVAPPGSKPSVPALNVDTIDGQIAALKSPNFAVRYLAQTKLHGGGAPAVAALKKMYDGEADPRQKARAVWLLARSPEGKTHVEAALKSDNADLRVTALRAARLIKMDLGALSKQLLGDSSPAVLRELALAMNTEPAEKAVPILAEIAGKYDGQDVWLLEAIGIGATGKEAQLLDAIKGLKNAKALERLTWRLKMEHPGAAAQAGGKQTTVASWRAVGPFDGSNVEGRALPSLGAALNATYGPDKAPGAIDLQAGYKGLDDKPVQWSPQPANAQLEGRPVVDLNAYCAAQKCRLDRVTVFFAANVIAPQDGKAALAIGSDDAVRVWLNGKVVHEFDGTRALAHGDDVAAVQLKKGSNLLLCKVVNGDGPGGLAVTVVSEWPVAISDDLSAHAAEIPLAGAEASASVPTGAPALDALADKAGKPLPPIEQLAALKGNAANGKAIFNNETTANCARCHQVGEKGGDIAPPLNTIGEKLSRAQLFESILYPSAGILMGYEGWIVRKKNGDIVDGLLATETADVLTIRDINGKYHDIPTDQVDLRKKQPLSIMPAGLNAALTQQELVDLVEYLTTLKNQ